MPEYAILLLMAAVFAALAKILKLPIGLALALSAVTLTELQLAGMEFRLEESPLNLRGLGHREWGDLRDFMPLCSNPPMPRTVGSRRGLLRI